MNADITKLIAAATSLYHDRAKVLETFRNLEPEDQARWPKVADVSVTMLDRAADGVAPPADVLADLTAFLTAILQGRIGSADGRLWVSGSGPVSPMVLHEVAPANTHPLPTNELGAGLTWDGRETIMSPLHYIGDMPAPDGDALARRAELLRELAVLDRQLAVSPPSIHLHQVAPGRIQSAEEESTIGLAARRRQETARAAS